MDAKISSATWNDPDLDEFTPEMLLTLHWMKTNPDRNDCGAYRFSPSRFTFETKGLDPSWHDKTRLALGELMLNEGSWFLYLPYLRECQQLGDVFCKRKDGSTSITNGWKAIPRACLALPKPLQRGLIGEYPNLIHAIAHVFHSLDVAYLSADTAEGLGKPLLRAYQGPEQSRAEQSRVQGECEGEAGAVIPSEEEVAIYAAKFQDLARGQGSIPEDYWMDWLAWRTSPKAGPFPHDWRNDLRLRFLASSVRSRANGPSSLAARGRRAELEEKLKNATTPEDRQRAREELQKLA